MASISFNNSYKLPAMVIRFTALLILPSSIPYPDADREKSPDTGFRPECNPSRLLIYNPLEIEFTSSSKLLSPFLYKDL